ncbi:MAG: hypothetical protein LBU65_08755 [Planctomycetaceae bacterium]|jgi:hypothetical protein|nr:hypothetical protein [Planctomycetaceae bacterium]
MINKFFNLPIKTRLGIVAGILLLGAVITYTASSFNVPHAKPVAVFLRLGMTLGAIWLAWDHLVSIPKTFWVMIPIVLIVAAFRPYYLFVAIPAMFLIMLLFPKRKKR